MDKEERICRLCGEPKFLESFPLDKDSAQGRRQPCKTCLNARFRERYYHLEIRSKAKHPEKKKARDKARSIPLNFNCEYCGATGNLHRHHSDYSRPLDVVTLCVTCHEAVHHKGLVVQTKQTKENRNSKKGEESMKPTNVDMESLDEALEIEVIQGVGGFCLAINETRVAGPKPLGGGTVIHRFVVPIKRIPALSNFPPTHNKEDANNE